MRSLSDGWLRMTYDVIDPDKWGRGDQYRLFRGYTQPHISLVARLDVTRLLNQRKGQGVSPYRACLYAIGAGIDAVPELRTRFHGEELRQYHAVEMSVTVPRQSGGFTFAELPVMADFATFDRIVADRLEAAAARVDFGANDGTRQDLVYLSCLPWMDFTAISNALPGPDDCIPRVAWGKFCAGPEGRWSMAMALEVHHALADGAHAGAYFAAAQQALDRI